MDMVIPFVSGEDMKDAIAEYLDYSDEEKKDIWDTANFVFDTNIFLNLYRLSAKTRDALLGAMTELQDRAWMPYHIAWEFGKDRRKVIYECENRYEDLQKEIENFRRRCRELLRLNEEDAKLNRLIDELTEWANEHRGLNLKVTNPSQDPILDQLLSIFNGKTGDPYSSEEFSELEKKSKKRYESKVPPGYMDKNKAKDRDDNNQYGDFIIWQQIIDYAKEQNRPIVYVTADQKEDWWYKVSGKTNGPRVELRKEFNEKVGQRIMFYSMVSFIENFAVYQGDQIDSEITDEIEHLNVVQGLGEAVTKAIDTHVEAIKSKIDRSEKSNKRLLDKYGSYEKFSPNIKKQFDNTKNNIERLKRELLIYQTERDFSDYDSFLESKIRIIDNRYKLVDDEARTRTFKYRYPGE